MILYLGAAKFALTANKRMEISLPNGKNVEKAFRGIAEVHRKIVKSD